MGIYQIKPWFQRQLQPITNVLVTNRVSPDWMTYGAFVIAVLMAVSIHQSLESRWWLLLVAAGVPVRLAMNALDGQVSRALNIADPMGEVKNELGDRIADIVILGSLCFVPAIPLFISIPALCTTFLVPYVGILSKAVVGVREYSGIMGKPDRMTVIAVAAILVALSNQWGWMSLGLGIIIFLGVHTMRIRLGKIHDRI